MSEDILVGYRGQAAIDTAYFFAPYRPGMTDAEIAEVNARIREANKPPTEIQQRIMRMVRHEDQITQTDSVNDGDQLPRAEEC